MNGFDQLDAKNPLCPYTRITRAQTKPYWDLAKRFTLADHAFSSSYAGDFVNRQYLIAGATRLHGGDYVNGNPTAFPYGCDAPPGTSAAMFDDDVPPPANGQRLGFGLRVPMIVISPYAKPGFVSHTTYETGGSTLRFIEETFGLRSLGATDVAANSIGDCFQSR